MQTFRKKTSEDLQYRAPVDREHSPQAPNLHHSLMSHTWTVSHIYVMCLICLGLKVLATMLINNYRDSGTWEASRMQKPPATDPAFKEFTALLRAYVSDDFNLAGIY